MNSEHHMARMSDDQPRGFGVRGDVRKKHAGVRADTLDDIARQLRSAIETRGATFWLDAHDAAYMVGWNAAAAYFAAAFTTAAAEIRGAL